MEGSKHTLAEAREAIIVSKCRIAESRDLLVDWLPRSDRTPIFLQDRFMGNAS